MRTDLRSLIFALWILGPSVCGASVILSVSRDEMSSGFFFGTPTVRGSEADSTRNLNAVTTARPFGVYGERTYMTFFDFDPSLIAGSVSRATLRLETLERGFGLIPPSVDEPFEVNVHAVSLLPAAIDTEATNGQSSVRFYNANHIGEVVATTALTAFGIAEWDIRPLINAWLSGENTVHALALTGSDEGNPDHALGIYNSTWAGLDGQQIPEIIIETETEPPLTLYEQWKSDHLGDVEAKGNEDPDHDGVANLLEYALQSDPLVKDQPTLIIAAPGGWMLHETLNTLVLAADVQLQVQQSESMVPDAWETQLTRQRSGRWQINGVEVDDAAATLNDSFGLPRQAYVRLHACIVTSD